MRFFSTVALVLSHVVFYVDAGPISFDPAVYKSLLVAAESPWPRGSKLLRRQDVSIGQTFISIGPNDSSTTIHMTPALSSALKFTFSKDTGTCPALAQKKSRRAFKLLHPRQDPSYDINCIVDNFITLMDNPHYLKAAAALYRASPLPLPIKDMTSLPRYQNDLEEEAFMSALMIGPGLIEYTLGVLEQSAIIWLTYATVDVAIYQLTRPTTFETVTTPKIGKMNLKCPKKEEVSCSHRLCNGDRETELCNGSDFLHGCACEKGQCPDFMFCESCGNDFWGINRKTGMCSGEGKPELKGCTCSHGGPYYNYPNRKDSHDGFMQIMGGPNWGEPKKPEPEPGPQPKDEIRCNRQKDEISRNPFNWKWVESTFLEEKITHFCEELKKNAKPEDRVYELDYDTDGNGDKNWNHMTLTARWIPGEGLGNPQTADCAKEMRTLADSCDGNDPVGNQFNYKWGGEFDKGHMSWSITPLKTRIAVEQTPETDWFVKGDDRHWWEINAKFPKNDHRLGKNGKPWDLIILHQCLHALRNSNWDPVNCADGLARFGGGQRNGYDSWVDCHENTWRIVSFKLMNTDAQALYGLHRGGLHATCWQGIDRDYIW